MSFLFKLSQLYGTSNCPQVTFERNFHIGAIFDVHSLRVSHNYYQKGVTIVRWGSYDSPPCIFQVHMLRTCLRSSVQSTQLGHEPFPFTYCLECISVYISLIGDVLFILLLGTSFSDQEINNINLDVLQCPLDRHSAARSSLLQAFQEAQLIRIEASQNSN